MNADKLTKWTKPATRDDVDITTISGFDLVFYELLATFANSKDFFTHFHKKTFTHYIGVDFHELGQKVYREYFVSPTQIESYYRRGLVLLDEISGEVAAWTDSVDLAGGFSVFRKQFSEVNRIYSIISWVAIEAWQRDFEILVGKLVRERKLVARREEIMAALCTPWRTTALADLQHELAASVAVEDLVDRYQFLRSWSVIWYRSIDQKWIESLQVPTGTNRELLQFDDALELLEPDKASELFLKLAPHIVFFKDWRDEIRRAHAYLWSPLFDEIASRFDVARFDLGYLTLDELATSLEEGKFPRALTEHRSSVPCVLDLSADCKIEVFDYGGTYEKIVATADIKSVSSAITGVVAYGGLVRGKVRVIRNFHDVRRVRDGDIVIANTTHPDYLPAMKRASAFVTNEGGMISHAAIVARELRKPCIVGAKGATEILKDGDTVEVDAENGVVRKI